MGFLLPHDDSVQDNSPGSLLSNGWAATQAAWAAAPAAAAAGALFRPGAMRRPAPGSGRLAGAADAFERWPVLRGLGNGPRGPAAVMLVNLVAAATTAHGPDWPSVLARRSRDVICTLPLRVCRFDAAAGALGLGAPAGLRMEIFWSAGGLWPSVSLQDEQVGASRGGAWQAEWTHARAWAWSCVCRHQRSHFDSCPGDQGRRGP
jgi:hypothetical protein